MPDFRDLVRQADQLAASGDYGTAVGHYSEAWEVICSDRPDHEIEEAFWLLMSWVNANFLAGEFREAHHLCIETFQVFADHGMVVGNPFFHLRAGQCDYELAPPNEPMSAEAASSVDNLSRALITGGPEIFEGEDPKYLEPILLLLQPPEGFASWAEARGQGCSADLLNGSTGHLRDLFTQKYGSPPPYDAPPEDPDQTS